MKKSIDLITNLFLGSIIIAFLIMLFYLTQKNYSMLLKSNAAVVRTGDLIRGHQNISTDFKNAIIYVSTYKNSPSQAYVHTYGKGLWEISIDMIHLKRLVGPEEKIRLDSLSKQIQTEEDWLASVDTGNPTQYDDRDRHIKNIVTIQNFFDNEISILEKQSIYDLQTAEYSLTRLHDWIIMLIISTSIIVLVTLLLISSQFRKVQMQNGRLMEIAWMQSHKVRAQVANLLGLSQLFDRDAPTSENGIIVSNIITTTKKLDGIVKEISEKTDV
jgi:hypothetical protein